MSYICWVVYIFLSWLMVLFSLFILFSFILSPRLLARRLFLFYSSRIHTSLKLSFLLKRHWKLNLFIITRIFNKRYFINYLSIVSEICYLLGCADPVSCAYILKSADVLMLWMRLCFTNWCQSCHVCYLALLHTQVSS